MPCNAIYYSLEESFIFCKQVADMKPAARKAEVASSEEGQPSAKRTARKRVVSLHAQSQPLLQDISQATIDAMPSAMKISPRFLKSQGKLVGLAPFAFALGNTEKLQKYMTQSTWNEFLGQTIRCYGIRRKLHPLAKDYTYNLSVPLRDEQLVKLTAIEEVFRDKVIDLLRNGDRKDPLVTYMFDKKVVLDKYQEHLEDLSTKPERMTKFLGELVRPMTMPSSEYDEATGTYTERKDDPTRRLIVKLFDPSAVIGVVKTETKANGLIKTRIENAKVADYIATDDYQPAPFRLLLNCVTCQGVTVDSPSIQYTFWINGALVVETNGDESMDDNVASLLAGGAEDSDDEAEVKVPLSDDEPHE